MTSTRPLLFPEFISVFIEVLLSASLRNTGGTVNQGASSVR